MTPTPAVMNLDERGKRRRHGGTGTVGGPQAYARLRDPRDVLAERQAIERQYQRHYHSDEYLA